VATADQRLVNAMQATELGARIVWLGDALGFPVPR
jgi:hypothetical protein